MGLLEVVLSAVVCAVVVLSVARISMKAGYSPWWALLPAAVTAVSFASLAVVHSHARFGVLSLHTVVHSARALAIADAACLAATVLLLVVFAVSDWPALTVATTPATAVAAVASAATTAGSATGLSKAHRRRRASASASANASSAVPARLRIRALPDVTGQPAGWFATGALGSGEQSYWDGTQWTAKRFWRNEMWINQPVEPSLLAEPMR